MPLHRVTFSICVMLAKNDGNIIVSFDVSVNINAINISKDRSTARTVVHA